MTNRTAVEHTHYRTCPLCEATCGLELTVRDGTVTRIRGDREDVFSRGFICPKGSTLRQLFEDPDRLRTPMVRRDGELRPASWEEAFEAVAEGLGRIWDDGDRDAVAIYLGNPTAHSVAGALFAGPLVKALGTRNVFSASTVDQMPKHASSGLLFGGAGAIPVPDLDRTDHLLMLGANPLESNGSLCTAPDFPGRLAAIRERGGRVVTVDPRRTRTAEVSDEHIAIRPGTDALWLAALVTEIHRAGLVRPGRLAEYLDGLDEVLGALAPFDADSVASHTRVDPEVTRRAARELAEAPRAAVYGRIGTHTTEFGTTASWLVEVLNVVTGNLDRHGGAMFPASAVGAPTEGRPPGGRGFTTGRWSSRVSGHPEVKGELPVAALAEEIETAGPGQVRALVTTGGNPVRSCPHSDRLDAALASLEFMVSVDIYLNETTRHADVLLPSPSPLAKPHFDFAFYGLSVRNVVNYSAPLHPADAPGEPGMDEHDVIARLALIAGGAGADADPAMLHTMIMAGIASRAGLDPEAEQASRSDLGPVEAMIDLMLATGPYEGLDMQALLASPHGIDLGPLRPRLPGLLRTVSGRIELASPALMADVPRLLSSLEQPPGDGLLLVGRRHLRSNNSWMHNIEVLVKGRPRCTLQVHPLDAQRNGIEHGAEVRVSSEAGAVVATAEVTDSVSVGTVSLPHGWGHDVEGTRGSVAARTDGVNSNVLTGDSVIDPLSGNARLNAIPVELEPTSTTRSRVAVAGVDS
ncbi:MAG: molybdopterin-dependent oxidoreductase [Microthrixaceae bacterium]